VCARRKQRNTADENIAANVTPFILEGWPLDTLDQTTMARLRRLPDRTGCTVADRMHEAMEQFLARKLAARTGWTIAAHIHEAIEQFLARRKANRELETKIIRFPSPDARSLPSARSNKCAAMKSGPIKRSFSEQISVTS